MIVLDYFLFSFLKIIVHLRITFCFIFIPNIGKKKEREDHRIYSEVGEARHRYIN